MKIIRIIALFLAALTVLSLTLSCAKTGEANETEEITKKEPEVTAEPFKGETGNYSGAKFQSVANTKVTAYEVYGEDNDKHFQKYLQDAQTLDGFFDKLTQKLIDGEKSAVVSPVNIYMALSLLAECTDGDSRKEILDVLGVSSVEQLREQAKRIWLFNNQDDESGRTLMANSIWLSYGSPAKDPCVNILKNDHYASVFCGDFFDDNYILALKQWLSDQTNGLLDSQIGELFVPPETTAVLASTIYYKSGWNEDYNNKYTGKFNGKAGQQNCEFNTKSSASNVYFGDGFTAYHDALSDGNTVWFFLPDENKTAAEILNKDLLTYINSDKESKFYDVTVSMPDFDVSYNESIIDKLAELGIKTCMTGSADFSPLLDGDHYLDEVIHAARFKADKDGVEGAAYTVMMLDGCADYYEDLQKYDFTLDRPFVFAVVRGGVPLFFGCVNDLQ